MSERIIPSFAPRAFPAADRRHRRRRALLLLVPSALLVAALMLTLVLRRAAESQGPVNQSATPAAIEGALEQRLAAVPLGVRWVECVTPRGGASRYRGAQVLRCAANFGDPHMPIYCSTIAGGALVTDRDVAALRC